MAKKFKPGDWALHKNGNLDSREVVEVSDDGTSIKIFLLTSPSPWLPAANYENLGPSS